MITIIISREKAYIGDVSEEDISDPGKAGVTLKNALEIRELMLPKGNGQVQRMINLAQISPFDKTTHTLHIQTVDGVCEVEENSDTIKAYEGFISELRMQNSGIVSAGTMPKNAPFDGKFGPSTPK